MGAFILNSVSSLALQLIILQKAAMNAVEIKPELRQSLCPAETQTDSQAAAGSLF